MVHGAAKSSSLGKDEGGREGMRVLAREGETGGGVRDEARDSKSMG